MNICWKVASRTIPFVHNSAWPFEGVRDESTGEYYPGARPGPGEEAALASMLASAVCHSGRSKTLEQRREAHAASDAHGHDTVPASAPAELSQEMTGAARSGGAKRMSDRDSSAVDVQLL